MTGLLRTAFLRRADTDTLASMTASILGALHGSDWLSDLAARVQDADYIARFETLTRLSTPVESFGQAQLFADGGNLEAPSSPIVSQRQLKQFGEELAETVAGAAGDFVDGRRFVVHEREDLKAKGSVTVTRWRLQTEDGQTLVVDQTRKSVSGDRRGARIEQPRSAPPLKEVRASVLRITVPVDDLPEVAGFYRNIVGLTVHGTGRGYVDLGAGLRLHQRPSTSLPLGHVVLEIIVSSLEKVRERIGSNAPRVRGNELEIRDPEGRTVLLREGL